MRKIIKKGFTLVELLVVIAILAILATVSVVGYTKFIEKANRSVDEQFVTQINTYLEAAEIADGKPNQIAAAVDVLKDNGIAVFEATYELNVLYWVGSENRVIIWTWTNKEKTTGEVTFPEKYAKEFADYTTPSASWAILNPEIKEIILESADQEVILEELNEAISKSTGENIVLKMPKNSNVQLSADKFEEALKGGSEFGKNVTLDLNGGTLTNDTSVTYEKNGKTYISSITVPSLGTLELTNGKINLTQSGASSGALVAETGSSVVLRNIELSTNGAAVFPASDASEVYIENCTIKGEGFAVSTNASSSYNVKITIKNSYLEADAPVMVNVPCEFTIEDSTIVGFVQGVIVRAGTAIIDNCKIYYDAASWLDGNWHYFMDDSSTGATAWSQGNSVPVAAITVGNDADQLVSYQWEASCKITNSEIHRLEGYMGIYIEGNSTESIGASLTYEGCTFYNHVGSIESEGSVVGNTTPQIYSASMNVKEFAVIYSSDPESNVTINGQNK